MTTNDPIDRGDAAATTLAGEADLAALFAPRRPDPQRFAAGVAARLRAASEPPLAVATPRAAGVAPLDLGVLGAGKAWLLTAPAALLAAALLTFVGSASSLRTSLRRAAGMPARPRPGEHAYHLALALQVLLWGSVFAIAAVVGIATSGFTDVALPAILASMALLACGVARSARGGRIERREVATIGVALLQVLCFVVPSALAGAGQRGETEWHPALPWLVVGMLLSMAAWLDVRGWSLALPGGLLVVWMGLGTNAFAWPATTPAPTKLAAALATSPPGPVYDVSWQDFAVAVAAVQAAGVEVALPAAVRQEFARAASAADHSGAATLSIAARIGAIDEATWRRLAGEATWRSEIRFRLRATALLPATTDLCTLAMLRVSDALTPAVRDLLAQNLLAQWRGHAFGSPLQDAATLVQWLDGIGRGDLVDDLRPELHATLARHQSKRRDAFAGGFCGRDVAAGVSSTPDTRAAIALMARVGVPAAVDAFALRRHLDRTLRLHETVRGLPRLSQLASAADLLAFDRLTGPLRRPWLRVVREERTLFGMALIALLFGFAIAFASPGPRRRAAMP